MAGSRAATPLARVIGVAAASWMTGACYVLQPKSIDNVPPAGSRIAVDVTDAGRVALGGQMGSGIAQVEGRLVGSNGSGETAELELAVSSVRLLDGGEQVWKGERVRIRQAYVSRLYDRELSTGRTVIAGALGAGLVTWFATRAITGFVHGSSKPSVPDSAHSVLRPARP